MPLALDTRLKEEPRISATKSFSRQRDREISSPEKSIRRISVSNEQDIQTFANVRDPNGISLSLSLLSRVYTRYRSLIGPLTRMAFRANTPPLDLSSNR